PVLRAWRPATPFPPLLSPAPRRAWRRAGGARDRRPRKTCAVPPSFVLVRMVRWSAAKLVRGVPRPPPPAAAPAPPRHGRGANPERDHLNAKAVRHAEERWPRVPAAPSRPPAG